MTRVAAASAAPIVLRHASALPGGTSLQDQLADLDIATQDVVVEIDDSLVHPLDIAAVPGTAIDGGKACASHAR